MHNDRMSSRARPARACPARARLTSAALLLALGASALTACSGDDESPSADPSGSEATTADSPYLEVPEGVELTAQGAELAFGDPATVAFEPRQGDVAALDLTVVSLEKASFKLFVGWKLSDETLATTPYFMQVKVKNVGDADLGGKRVPVYGVDGENKLIESSTFASSFKPCPSASFPDKFATGDTFKTCLVYLAPDAGELTAASFRPTEEFNPIVWTGEIGKVDTGADKGDKNGDKKDGDKAGRDGNQSKGGGKAG